MFKNMKIVTVLFLILAIFGVMQLATNGLYFNAVRENRASIATEQTDSARRNQLHQLWASLLQTRSSLNRAALRINMFSTENNTDAEADALLALATRQLAEADAKFAEFQNMKQLNMQKPDHLALIENYTNLQQKLQELNAFLSKRDIQSALAQPTQRYQEAFEQAYNEWLTKNREKAREGLLESEENYNESLGLAIMMLLLITVALGGMWIILQRILLRPLNHAMGHINRITEGDLTAKIDIQSRNEMGQLAASLRTMQQSLARTVRDVRSGADVIYTSASKISLDSGDLASRTEQQAASLEETAASMEELTATVKQNADNARQASQLALSASETAQKGGKVVDGVVQTMSEIAESSKKIADIISVIDGIAFQTNILALNAAVEAARAGENGRGFAVVAGEVRSLAQRSAVAAKDIKGLIEESSSRVGQGTKLAAAAEASMEAIVVGVKQVRDIMDEISSASEEQSRGIGQVGIAVAELDRVTQQNASLVEESSSASSLLQEQAQHLNQTVATFRLDASARPAAPTRAQPATLTPRSKAPRPAAMPMESWESF